jgi:hypothetical protein
LLLTEAAIENNSLTQEASDESLITAAKSLNASYNGHLRRSIEDFWKLGQTLCHLYQRRHLKGRWADILHEIGISTTTDNHARRLHANSTLDGLVEYKNKTAALRGLGILSTPSLPTPVATGDVGRPNTKVDADVTEVSSVPAATRPDSKISPVKRRSAVEAEGITPASSGGDHGTVAGGRLAAQVPDDSLEVLAKIAARLEYMAADKIKITTDHLAQIDRAIRALDLIRTKGDAHVAA